MSAGTRYSQNVFLAPAQGDDEATAGPAAERAGRRRVMRTQTGTDPPDSSDGMGGRRSDAPTTEVRRRYM